MQAQKLREKVAIDISKQKRKIGEPSLETIYLPKKAHQTISSKSQINHENTRVSGAAIDAQPKADKQSSIISKKVIGTAVPKQTNKIKSKAKNFIAVNKSNLKNLKPHSKSPSTFSPGGSSIVRSIRKFSLTIRLVEYHRQSNTIKLIYSTGERIGGKGIEQLRILHHRTE